MRRSEIFVRAALFALVPLACSGALASACGATEEVKFGGPNALSKDKAPPTPGDQGGAGGNGTGGSDAGSGGLNCAADGAACTVKWKTEIYPMIKSGGAWACSGGNTCHNGVASPAISDTDPDQAYAQLRAFTGIRAKPYINCGGNPADSPILCNLTQQGAGDTCGSVMPKWPDGGRGAFGTPEYQKLDTWIKCGAPNN
jgi:hypothetical protein